MVISTLETSKKEFFSGSVLRKDYVHFSERDCSDLDLWIGRLLRNASLEFLQEIIFTILSELLTNGFKANAKRILFEMHGLDIKNPNDYQKGMQFFKAEFASQQIEIFQKLEESDYRLFLEARNTPDFVEFRIQNNASLLEEEEIRIRKRIQASEKFNSIGDAYKDSLDSEESSGLGIILIHILLRNSGIKDSFFHLEKGDSFTSVVVRLPKHMLGEVERGKIRETIKGEIDGLPPIPRQIQKLIQLSNQSDVSWETLSKEVEVEPAIATELLKTANSPFFAGQHPVTDLKDCLKRIGLKHIHSVFLSLAARRILDAKYPKQKLIWNHGVRVSIFAKSICQKFPQFRSLETLAVLSGLIHDLGRMVLLSFDLTFLEKIKVLRQSFQGEIHELSEEFALGISHSEIGFCLGEKWGFPSPILDVLRYHHKPWLCESNFQPLVEVIYIADAFSHIHSGKGNYYSFEPEILSKFEIRNEEEMSTFGNDLESLYTREVQGFQDLFL